MKSCILLFVALMVSGLLWACVSCASLDDLLLRGKEALIKGDFNEALTAYDAAVKLNPSNYMIYYRRGTAYLAAGKSKSALADFNKVIQLQPDFMGAYMQRASYYLKAGKPSSAIENYDAILAKEASNEEAKKGKEAAEKLDVYLKECERVENAGSGYEQQLVHLLTEVVEIAPYSENLRMRRAQAFISVGDLHGAVGDVTRATKLKSDHTEGFFLLSNLYYKLGDAEQSLNSIRECLKLDQDHKACHKHYTKAKKLNRQVNELNGYLEKEAWAECIQKAAAALKTERKERAFVNFVNSKVCHCQQRKGDMSQAIKTCTSLINDVDVDRNVKVNALCDRAEAYLNLDNFDKAISDYQMALDIDEHTSRAKEGMDKAQKLKKQAGKRNYYKILGVNKNASKREIMKAYKKLALEWHPDKYNGDDKEMADQKFVDINAAKEVLTDPEKRKQFDSGVDPLDPEAQKQQGNPFGEGFHPFAGGFGGGSPFGGSGGQRFTFHFG